MHLAKKNIDKSAMRNYIRIRVYPEQTERRCEMFRNLEAEQARHGMTNSLVAEHLGLSRVSYENKKKSGKFTTVEAKKLCLLFSCSFEYLFATETDTSLVDAH